MIKLYDGGAYLLNGNRDCRIGCRSRSEDRTDTGSERSSKGFFRSRKNL